MGRFNIPELLGGVFLIALGLFAIWEASGYSIGSATRMGPGYFPVLLGSILVLFGVALSIAARGAQTSVPPLPWRPVLAISCGIVAFGLLIEWAGLLVAVTVLVVLCSLAEQKPRPVTVAVMSIVLAAFAYLVFIEGFALPVRVTPWG